MLSGKFRFHGHGALRLLFGHGRTLRFKSLSLRAAAHPRRTNSRVAVVVSKKVIKASPKRNRVRRRVYEILRNHWSNIKAGHDVLITIYDPAVWDMPHDQLQAEVIDALKKARLWTDQESKGSSTPQA
jgi:ribonuclease P protein component